VRRWKAVRGWFSDDLTEIKVWGFALLVGVLLVGAAYQKTQATEFSESQQRERTVKAVEAQAKALQDIAASLKKLERCR
jgi:hypothetical protein